MARTLSNPAGLHPAPGFSHVAVSRGSTMVHFAGQIALDENFGIIGGADLFEQTQAAMRNLETAMNEAGVAWQDIVRRTIYTTQPTQYELITSAIHSVTGGADDPPKRSSGSRHWPSTAYSSRSNARRCSTEPPRHAQGSVDREKSQHARLHPERANLVAHRSHGRMRGLPPLDRAPRRSRPQASSWPLHCARFSEPQSESLASKDSEVTFTRISWRAPWHCR